MKIAIDAFRVVCEPQTSGAVYVAELAAALAESEQVSAIYLVIPNRAAPAIGLPAFSSSKVHWLVSTAATDPSTGFYKALWWMQRTYPATVKALVGDVDWFIAPYHQTPIRVPGGARVLTVIHDLCGLRADCGYRKLGRGYWRHFTNFLTAAIGADALIAISEFTRVEIQRQFPSMKKLPTRVAYNAVTAARLTDAASSAAIAQAGVARQRYFLAYAAPGPRKGTDITLQSYARYRRAGGTAALVLIGGRNAVAAWTPLAESLNLTTGVTWLSGVSDHARDALYAQAIALLFPSRCEGFGYPIVEAMRQGCPVAADADSPAAEIVGDSQALMRVLSVEALVAEMTTLEALAPAARGVLAERLHAASQRFSGHGLASQFLALLCAPPSVALRRRPQP